MFLRTVTLTSGSRGQESLRLPRRNRIADFRQESKPHFWQNRLSSGAPSDTHVLRKWPWEVGAVGASFLAARVGVAGVVVEGVVGPVALNLPVGAVEEHTEEPPKVQAHLSPFSAPPLSYQALPSGSERVSESSCPVTLAIACRPCDWPLTVLPRLHPALPSSLKKKPNSIATPWKCPFLASRFCYEIGT